MTHFPEEFPLEEQIRDVPLPAGFVERLKRSRIPRGAALDAELREVEVPAGLLDRLRTAVADESLDERLRAVPPPSRLLTALRAIPYERQRPSTVGRLAVAASLMLLIGGGYLAALGGILGTLRPRPLDAVASNPLPPLELQAVWQPASASSETWLVSDLQVVEASEALASGAATESSWDDVPLHLDDRRISGVVDEMRTQFVHWQPMENVLLLQVGPLGASGSTDDRLPALERVRAPRARGLEPPNSPPSRAGFDRSFLLARGIFPPSFPAQDSRLRQMQAPLITSTASWHRAREMLDQGVRPNQDEVRVEEFLAAWDYGFAPARAGEVALRTAAGPAIFGQPGSQLIQLAAVAGQLPEQSRPPTHVTLALDVSASMSLPGRWERMYRGVDRWLSDLGPADRVSLLAFSDASVRRIEAAGGSDLAEVRKLLDSLRPRGGSNLAEAMREALSLSLTPLDVDCQSRLVLIAGGQARMTDENEQKLSSLLALAADQGVRTSVFDLAGSDADDGLEKLARVGHGDYFQVESADELRWQLFETTHGRSGVVAADAVLHVEFNPAAVHAYRLVGHEPTLMTGMAADSVEQSLRAGETATLLYEVWLRDTDATEVAWVHVAWRDPETGESRETPRRRVSRLQFATSLAEMSLSLQAAALVSETAEVLRGGYSFSVDNTPTFVPRPKPVSVDHLLAAATTMNPRLTQRDDFRELLRVIRRIEAAGLGLR